jgi:integrase
MANASHVGLGRPSRPLQPTSGLNGTSWGPSTDGRARAGPDAPGVGTRTSPDRPQCCRLLFLERGERVTTAIDDWRQRFARFFRRAGIEGGHPHRFRDTFAVDLLLRGIPIDQVSALLGHSAVKITEQHYLAFVAGRRKQIVDAVRRAWENGNVA